MDFALVLASGMRLVLYETYSNSVYITNSLGGNVSFDLNNFAEADTNVLDPLWNDVYEVVRIFVSHQCRPSTETESISRKLRNETTGLVVTVKMCESERLTLCRPRDRNCKTCDQMQT